MCEPGLSGVQGHPSPWNRLQAVRHAIRAHNKLAIYTAARIGSETFICFVVLEVASLTNPVLAINTTAESLEPVGNPVDIVFTYLGDLVKQVNAVVVECLFDCAADALDHLQVVASRRDVVGACFPTLMIAYRNDVQRLAPVKCGIGSALLVVREDGANFKILGCLLYTSPSPRDGLLSRMPSSA